MRKVRALSDEFIYFETLESGLRVAIHPKNDFKRIVASLQVSFGGMDYKYTVNNKTKTIPHGVAHFLEHMIFSNDGKNLAEEFSFYGANVNAYTSKSLTNYKFNCTDNFEYLLDYFLTSFMKPEFSDESIQKEKNIINHEIAMSHDSIHHEIYLKLKHLMYSDNGITEDVGGRFQDIEAIDKDLLVDVFNTFYHPKNMTLVITGNVNPEAVIKMLRQHEYNKKSWQKYYEINRVKDNRARRIHHYKKIVPNNESNMISIGIKIPDEIFEKYSRDIIHISLGTIISNAFGLASQNYDILKKLNLMNVSFSTNSNLERDYGYVNIYMQTNKHEKYYNTIMKMIDDIYKKPLDHELFEIDRKMILGNYITVFDSISRIHDFLASCMIEDIDIETYLNKILTLNIEDLDNFKAIFKKENIFSVRYLIK
jgi:predicted Zn-dependent peptidase